MIGLVRAELRKLVTVPTTWVVSAVGLQLVLAGAGLVLFATGLVGPFGATDAEVAGALDQVGANGTMVLVVGILSMTTEFRHGTIGRTLQITPSRTRVLVAKAIAASVHAVAFAAAAGALVAVLVVVAAARADVDVVIGEQVGRSALAAPVGLVLTAILGVAVGALLRSQVVAVTVALVWVFVVEGLAVALVPGVARWLPFQALGALFPDPASVTESLAEAGLGPAMVPLPPLVGLGVFLGHVVATGLAAIVLLRRRDV